MLPLTVNCEDCGQIATVRGFGRIEYDWPQTTNPGHEPTTPTITCVRLTIDCPHCGVKTQEFYPAAAAGSSAASTSGREAANRRQKAEFSQARWTHRQQFGVR